MVGSLIYLKERKMNQLNQARDDREDDEHGGGPTPWDNPDRGWAPY